MKYGLVKIYLHYHLFLFSRQYQNMARILYILQNFELNFTVVPSYNIGLSTLPITPTSIYIVADIAESINN